MEDNKLTNLFAWSGFRWLAVTVLLVAYILVSNGYLDGKSVLFNVLNSTGSLLLVVNSLSIKPKDWAVAVFNLIWLGISIFAIFKSIF